MQSFRRQLYLVVAAGLLAVLGPAPSRGDVPTSIAVDEPMYHDPELAARPTRLDVDPRLLDLWKKALARPEVDLRRRTVEALGLVYTQGLHAARQFVPQLCALLVDGQPDALRQAAVQTLTLLDDPAAAPQLLVVARAGDPGLQMLIDPALARWGYVAAVPDWLARATDAAAPVGPRTTAIAALGTVKAAAARDPLRRLVLDPTAPASVRLRAAEALAVSAPDDELATATALRTPGAGVLERLAAASLLMASNDPADRPTLLALIADDDPAVAVRALTRLVAIDGRLVADHDEMLVSHRSGEVRRLTVDALEVQQTPAAIRYLGTLLGDERISVRTAARDALLRLAKSAPLEGPVLTAAHLALASPNWRAREQAADLVGLHGDRSPTARLLELINDPRGEVAVAAIAALRHLGQPATIPPLIAHGKELAAFTRAVFAGGDSQRYHDWMVDEQLGQINQFLGQAGHTQDYDYLKQFLPKPPMYRGFGVQARASAYWALGKLYATDQAKIDELLPLFNERIHDDAQIVPELPAVKQMVALAYGRFHVAAAVGILQEPVVVGRVGEQGRWAIARIRGELYAPLPLVTGYRTGYFLEPAR